jgi:hypothetical protein
VEQHRLLSQRDLDGVDVDEPVMPTDDRLVAGILPRELDATLSVDIDLFAEAASFAQAYKLARQYIGAEIEADDPQLIEAQADE